MAAGLGFKTFTTGEVLTAADTNGYLMQGVLVFASAAARDAAITSPQEGQFAFLKDTNITTYYTGSAWANLDTTGMTNPMTTTGDMVYSSSGSTPARLGIGTTGQVVTVAGGIPSWATPASGGMTSIASGSLTGSSVTLSSIVGTYNDLQLVIFNFRPSSDLKLMMRFNGASTGYKATPGTFTSNTTYADTELFISSTADGGGASTSLIVVDIPGYANATTNKFMTYSSLVNNATTNANGDWERDAGLFKSTAAITSITLLPQAAGTFTTGTYILYGVK